MASGPAHRVSSYDVWACSSRYLDRGRGERSQAIVFFHVIRRERANGEADIGTLWLRWTPGQARQDKPSWADVAYKPDFSESCSEAHVTSVQKLTLKIRACSLNVALLNYV